MKAAAVVVVAALAVISGSARDAVAKGQGRLEKTEDTVEGGTHWRVKTDAGAVHVWVPAGYDRATAGTVVYVHGYYTDADGAWKDHDLAKQFRASKQNALFIVPDAPSGNDESVAWNALTDLRRAIVRANIRLPDGPTIVMGHSGAFRTVMKWVDHKVVAEVILLDALYGGQTSFDDFIGTGKRAKQHKLIVVGSDTATASSAFTKKYPFAVSRDKMPASADDFTKREKKAKLLYVRSQYGHMEIVTGGKVIPSLLRLTPLRRVGTKTKDATGAAQAASVNVATVTATAAAAAAAAAAVAIPSTAAAPASADPDPATR